jgi:hypothetical protein
VVFLKILSMHLKEMGSLKGEYMLEYNAKSLRTVGRKIPAYLRKENRKVKNKKLKERLFEIFISNIPYFGIMVSLITIAAMVMLFIVGIGNMEP